MEGNIMITNTTSVDNNDDDGDRISELPDFVAHHILSFLYWLPESLIRMSVLSKRWFALTASFPILHFDFSERPWACFDRQYAKERFSKYVAYTVSRFPRHQNVINFYLRADLRDPALADIINTCLPFILKQGLQEFRIVDDIGGPSGNGFNLPNILLSVTSLTSLHIQNCFLPCTLKYGDDDLVRFKLLKLLYLCEVYLSEEEIKCLTAGCPLLEEFTVSGCHGFNRLCLFGMQNLRKVVVCYSHRRSIEEIDIHAPNLTYILLSVPFQQICAPPCINLFSAKKLSMVFSGCFSQQFAVSLSNFPFLETLILKLSRNDTKLKLSSHSLRTLSLDTQSALEEIEIDTPNLLYFQYCLDCNYEHDPIRNSGESKACMECYCEHVCDTIWFQQIRQFLDMKIAFKVLKLHIETNFIDIEELKLLQWPPFELEHVELNLLYISELSEYVPLLEAVLWCFRPQSLTLNSFYFDNDHERNEIVKFTYEKLLQQEVKDKTNIQIVLSTVKACGPNDLLITFSKEEVSHKASQDSAIQKENKLVKKQDNEIVKRLANMEI